MIGKLDLTEATSASQLIQTPYKVPTEFKQNYTSLWRPEIFMF
jgi:hypothetical protein